MPHPFLAIKEAGISALPILPNVPFDIQNSSNLKKEPNEIDFIEKTVFMVCIVALN